MKQKMFSWLIVTTLIESVSSVMIANIATVAPMVVGKIHVFMKKYRQFHEIFVKIKYFLLFPCLVPLSFNITKISGPRLLK